MEILFHKIPCINMIRVFVVFLGAPTKKLKIIPYLVDETFISYDQCTWVIFQLPSACLINTSVSMVIESILLPLYSPWA